MSSEDLRLASLIVAAIGQTLFVLLYLLWPWWEDFLGRALFFKALALMAALDLGLLFRVIEWKYEDYVFTILYMAFALGVLVQFIAFLRVYLRKGRPGDRNVASHKHGGLRKYLGKHLSRGTRDV